MTFPFRFWFILSPLTDPQCLSGEGSGLLLFLWLDCGNGVTVHRGTRSFGNGRATGGSLVPEPPCRLLWGPRWFRTPLPPLTAQELLWAGRLMAGAQGDPCTWVCLRNARVCPWGRWH